jgi:hypothetical protein
LQTLLHCELASPLFLTTIEGPYELKEKPPPLWVPSPLPEEHWRSHEPSRGGG